MKARSSSTRRPELMKSTLISVFMSLFSTHPISAFRRQWFNKGVVHSSLSVNTFSFDQHNPERLEHNPKIKPNCPMLYIPERRT